MEEIMEGGIIGVCEDICKFKQQANELKAIADGLDEGPGSLNDEYVEQAKTVLVAAANKIREITETIELIAVQLDINEEVGQGLCAVCG